MELRHAEESVSTAGTAPLAVGGLVTGDTRSTPSTLRRPRPAPSAVRACRTRQGLVERRGSALSAPMDSALTDAAVGGAAGPTHRTITAPRLLLLRSQGFLDGGLFDSSSARRRRLAGRGCASFSSELALRVGVGAPASRSSDVGHGFPWRTRKAYWPASPAFPRVRPGVTTLPESGIYWDDRPVILPPSVGDMTPKDPLQKMAVHCF